MQFIVKTYVRNIIKSYVNIKITFRLNYCWKKIIKNSKLVKNNVLVYLQGSNVCVKEILSHAVTLIQLSTHIC